MGRVIGPRMIPAVAIKTAFPFAAHPRSVPKYAAPKSTAAKFAGAKYATHPNAGLKDPSAPFTLQQDGPAIYGVFAERSPVIKLARIQNQPLIQQFGHLRNYLRSKM